MSDLLVAFSGGKDSTAMVLRMAELGERGVLWFTPAGNEPPELQSHIESIRDYVQWPLVVPDAPTLRELIDEFNAMPNARMRWCTRRIKIEPCIVHLKRHPGSTLCVGLRGDEEERQGLYGDYATYRYPMREWGWSIHDVRRYLDDAGVQVPKRTDCMWCYAQRLGEWYDLWRDRPEMYAEAEALEDRTGHTLRSDSRDTWPAALKEMRIKFEDEQHPRTAKIQLPMFEEDEDEAGACRICRM